jgi:hypothetical protein
MISSQSTSTVTDLGLLVKQTVGQASPTGNFSNKFSVQQGYHHSYWATYLASPTDISIISYPNPFTQFINFSLTGSNATKIMVQIFDINGKSLYLKKHVIKNRLFKVVLSELTEGVYMVKITSENKSYFTKIIKK